MNDDDLDDSYLVTVLTWVLYLGWLTGMSAIALRLGVEPLPSVQAQFPGWAGTFGALGVGVAFILVTRQIYDQLKKRYWSPPQPEPDAAAPPETASQRAPQKQRPKNKKKRGF